MTREPCRGLSMRRTANGHPVVRLHYTANPRCTPEWVEQARAKYSSQPWWDLEMELAYEALSGSRVYPEFDVAVHTIRDEEVPQRGCRYMSIDPHPRTPHAFLWILIDRWADLYVYRDLWPSVVWGASTNIKDDVQDNAYTIKEYAETVALLEGSYLEWVHPEEDDEYGIFRRGPGAENIVYRYMDQAGKAFQASGESQLLETYARRYDRYGIQCQDPYKSHRAGEDAIRQALKLRRHDTKGLWPKLHIAQSCKELILEFQKYRYRIQKGSIEERELKQDGVEARTHQLDNLRYLLTSALAYIPTLES